MKKLKFWGQEVEETDSGLTWRVLIKQAFWDRTVGLNAKMVEEAVKKDGRRFEVQVSDPECKFIILAQKVVFKGIPYWRKSKFEDGEDMKFYMIKIPRKKYENL